MNAQTNEFLLTGMKITRMAALLSFILLLGEVAGKDNDLESQKVCQQFTADEELKNLIKSKLRTAKPCACVEKQVMLDYSFEKIGHCYRQWIFEDGVKQMCCYSADGMLQIGPPQGGYLTFDSFWKNMSEIQRSCCVNETTCDIFYDINPSDDCSSYQSPTLVTSFGDPHIETVDGAEFDFNGHGEYVFLKTSKLEIQVRLEYTNPGNVDSTLFTAFSIYDYATSDYFEMHLDRQNNDIKVYRNGTQICYANQKGPVYPCVYPPERDHCMVNVGGGKAVIQGCAVNEFAKTIVFTAGEFISLSIDVIKNNEKINITGLAGRQQDKQFVFRNGTKVDVNSTASVLFDYGESWTLTNKSESNFNYSIAKGNYTYYNENHSHPRFLEELVGNLTALFKGYTKSNISLFNTTCINDWDNTPNAQCLLAIARTGDINQGIAEMSAAKETHHIWETLHNNPPNVSESFPENITVRYKEDLNWKIDLKDYVYDDNTDKVDLKFEVQTELPKTEYTLDNGVFKWTVGTGLRYIDTDISFIVIDSLNVTSKIEITVNYCGCEEPEQCSSITSDSNSTDTIKKALCKCPEYVTGLYCEKVKNTCPNITCYQNDLCNATAYQLLDSWPCAPCPNGRHQVMTPKQQTCEDIDECDSDYTGKDKCQQNCSNTDGSFTCSCRSGYTLNADNHTCDARWKCSVWLQLPAMTRCRQWLERIILIDGVNITCQLDGKELHIGDRRRVSFTSGMGVSGAHRG
ncbi:mucin-like protein [Mercenaria mercenaria]|uniref:mucin-like protein n=1 Tax=Mercenaria mercenaria TaxID=6596 RepID=UPI00234F6F6A|nr:mucin-like protein [Mercenaria mercenaria]